MTAKKDDVVKLWRLGEWHRSDPLVYVQTAGDDVKLPSKAERFPGPYTVCGIHEKMGASLRALSEASAS